MSTKASKIIVIGLTLLALTASAIPNYQKCLDCFYQNRTSHFYCNAKDMARNTCMDKKAWDCLEEDKIDSFEQCPEIVSADDTC